MRRRHATSTMLSPRRAAAACAERDAHNNANRCCSQSTSEEHQLIPLQSRGSPCPFVCRSFGGTNAFHWSELRHCPTKHRQYSKAIGLGSLKSKSREPRPRCQELRAGVYKSQSQQNRGLKYVQSRGRAPPLRNLGKRVMPAWSAAPNEGRSMMDAGKCANKQR